MLTQRNLSTGRHRDPVSPDTRVRKAVRPLFERGGTDTDLDSSGPSSASPPSPPPELLRRTSSTRPPELLMGYIHKEGSLVPSWKHRYFVLNSSGNDTTLTYYTKQTPQGAGPPYGRNEKGCLDMRGYEVHTAPDEMTLFRTIKHVLVLSCPADPQRRRLKLAFNTEDALQMWKDALCDHIAFADYAPARIRSSTSR
mmetsp:Transcript_23353/g.39614  ORF Transcript_23353/g.39614 Transcript_23353/m.39614 type:complete len:197 (+) Transcript_23353:415-1005(+)